MKRLVFLLLVIAPLGSWADSTILPAKPYSYGANIGWIHWNPESGGTEHGVTVHEYFLSGYAYAANVGWIHLGDGTPPNGIQYANSSASNYGVNHDPGGALSGFAYGANIGWVQFEQVQGRPRIDLITGTFSGYAYGANIGWINLETGELVTEQVVCRDTDRDGLGDEWEREAFNNLGTANATSNSDSDMATDAEEYIMGTDPRTPKSVLAIAGESPDASADAYTVEFPSVERRVYAIEYTTNLVSPSWTDSGLGVFNPDAGGTTTRAVNLPGVTPQAWRVRVQKPLP